MIFGKSSWSMAAVLAAVVASLSCMPAVAASTSTDRVRIVVAFKHGMASQMREAIARAGGRVVSELPQVEAVAVDLPQTAYAALQSSPYAKFVEKAIMRHVMGRASSRSTLINAVAADGTQVTPYGITMVQADQLSDAVAADRTICIVDSGIDAQHEDHQGNKLDGVNHSGSGSWDTDEAAHGTHVAGTIAAVNNTVGVIGVMPNKHVHIYISKVFDASGSAYNYVIDQGMLSCRDAGANVVSMSLGGSGYTQLDQAVVTLLANSNILLIAAAGNAGDSSVSYPAGFPQVVSVAAIDSSMNWASFSQFNPDVELAGPGVGVLSTIPPNIESLSELSVAGAPYDSAPMAGSPRTTATSALYDFGTGEADDSGVAGKVCLIQRGNISFADKVTRCQNNGGIAAVIYNNVPGMLYGTLGTAVTSIPSLGTSDTIGAQLLTQIGASTTVTVAPDPSLYAYFDGTSMATPHVSAVAALVWSRHPGCTAKQIRKALDLSALDLGAPGRDDYFGFGLVQAKAANNLIRAVGCAPR
jgi:serine protease